MNKKEIVPTITVSIFGGSGSGKTTYFASLYKVLKDYSRYKFKIDSTNHKTITKLDNYWSQISDTNGNKWPAGTITTDDYEFSCYVKVEAQEYETCKFRYVDYSGGFFSNNNDENTALSERMKETDIAFILLDSYQIAKSTGQTNSTDLVIQWMNELNAIFNLIERTNKKNIPVHFIVTKYDYLQSFNSNKFNNLMSLKKEIKSMCSHSHGCTIQKFIDSRIEKNHIRLIPVSSVGQAFTEYDINDENITTKKRPRSSPEPYNVEVPIAYALVDILELTNKKSEEKIKSHKNVVRYFLMLGRYLNALVQTNFSPSLQRIVVQLFINSFVSNFLKTNLRFNSVKNYKQALTTHYNICKEIIEEFEANNGTIFR